MVRLSPATKLTVGPDSQPAGVISTCEVARLLVQVEGEGPEERLPVPGCRPQQGGDRVQHGVQGAEAGLGLVAEEGGEEPGQVPEETDLSPEDALSEGSHHHLALPPHLAPDHGQPHLGLAPADGGGGEEGEEGRRGGEGGEGGVAVEGGGHTQPRLLQQPQHGLQGEDRVCWRTSHHNVLSPPGQQLVLANIRDQASHSNSHNGNKKGNK